MKLISLNVEGKKHWERITPFLERERPEVLCLQEVFGDDATRVAERFGMSHRFEPMVLKESGQPSGIAIFSSAPMNNVQSKIYYSPAPDIKQFEEYNKRATIRELLLSMDVERDGKIFTVATTHFTWTPTGFANEDQRVDAEALLKILSNFPDVVLCGDFNIPRGFNDLYEKFTARYEDAVPKSYISSLDLSLHGIKNNPVERLLVAQFMIDYIFLSKKYRAENVRLQSGLSDHCAVVATLSLK